MFLGHIYTEVIRDKKTYSNGSDKRVCVRAYVYTRVYKSREDNGGITVLSKFFLCNIIS